MVTCPFQALSTMYIGNGVGLGSAHDSKQQVWLIPVVFTILWNRTKAVSRNQTQVFLFDHGPDCEIQLPVHLLVLHSTCPQGFSNLSGSLSQLADPKCLGTHRLCCCAKLVWQQQGLQTLHIQKLLRFELCNLCFESCLFHLFRRFGFPFAALQPRHGIPLRWMSLQRDGHHFMYTMFEGSCRRGSMERRCWLPLLGFQHVWQTPYVDQSHHKKTENHQTVSEINLDKFGK